MAVRLRMMTLIAIFGLPFVRAPLIAQVTQPEPRIVPPDEIRIKVTVDKPGQREMRELKHSAYDYCYDPLGDDPLDLRHFSISRRSLDNQRFVYPGCNWWTKSNVKNGQLYPFLGQVYRWNGEENKLQRIPNHVLAQNRDIQDQIKRLTVVRQLDLSWPYHRFIYLDLTINDFEQSVEGPKRVHVRLSFGEKKTPDPKDESRTNEQKIMWVVEGESIHTPNFDLIVDRIVLPNSDEKNPGWIDMTVNPGPKMKESR